MPDFTDDKRHDSLDGHCAEGCPCLRDKRPRIFSSWGEALLLLCAAVVWIRALSAAICKLVRWWPGWWQ